MARISGMTISRLSLYRRILGELLAEGRTNVRSRELADLARGTPAQVRRDLMAASGCRGRPSHGYDVEELLGSIEKLLDRPDGEAVALVGAGNLGRALLAYLRDRKPRLTIRAVFDSDRTKVGRSISGCRCCHVSSIGRVVRKRNIRVAVIAVPAAAAQGVAEALVKAGVRGLLNFAPVRLSVPADVFVEDIDISMSLEKTAYFARENG